MDPAIPAKQRALVNLQLKRMREGNSPAHFQVLADILGIVVKAETNVPTLSILDAGCASGYYSEIINHFLPQKFQYTGSDFNPAMLQLAKTYYPNLVLAQMDLRNLAWRDKSFDIVLSGAVLVHIKDWQKALQELMRVSKKYLALHRALIALTQPTIIRAERHYDVQVYRVFIQEEELMSLTQKSNFRLVHKMDCDEGNPGQDFASFTYLFEKAN